MHVFRVFIVLVAIRTSECCSCAILHPQSWYCSSDFVIKGRVKAAEVIVEENDSSWAPSFLDSYNLDRTFEYSVYVQKVYKGGDIVLPKKNVRVFSRGFASCQPVYLETKKSYILMGQAINNELEIESCGYATLISRVTKRQLQGFKSNYKKICNQCSICGNYGCDYYDSNNGQCTLDFSYYGSYGNAQQCEIDFASCGLDEDGNCAWLGRKDYRKCKEQE